MPQQASQSSNPPLPPGYTLDAPAAASSSVPPLPPGYSLDSPPGQHPRGFLSGLYDSVAGGFKSLASGFTDKPTEGTLFDKALDAQTAEGSKAVDNAKQGRYSEAAGHGLAAVVPGFGPAAAKAGEDIGSGNTGYGLGEAAGLIGQAAGPGLVEKIPDGTLTAPVRAGARAAEAVVNSKLKPIAKLMTPADEATAAKIKVPGRDFGLPKRGQLASDVQAQAAPAAKPEAPPAPVQTSAPMKRGSISQMMNDIQSGVEKGTGASPPPNPKAPIYQRGGISSAMQEGAPDMPQGHTAHQSSALRSSMYDPSANEFHARMTSGDTTYVYGDVSPDEAKAFTDAGSKGSAYQQIKGNHPLVAKIVNGKRVAVKASQ